MEKVKVEENNSLQRINSRCIDCGACLQTCEALNGLDKETCIHCGQCILTCPMGALQPKYNYKEVLANLHDEEKIVVVSVAPAVRVAIGDAFGYAPGEFLEDELVGALKHIGFSYVFDVSFGADLTIMEESSGGRYYVTEAYEQNSLQGRLDSANVAQYSGIIEEWLRQNPNKINEIPFLFRIENLAPNRYTRKRENGEKNYYTVGKNNKFGETDLLSKHIDILSQTITTIGTQDRHLRPRKGDIEKINVSLIDYNYLSIILLEYFLHLGLPSDTLQRFMNVFGFSFGNGLKLLCKGHGLSESYIKYLIESGISYRAIAFLIESESSIFN